MSKQDVVKSSTVGVLETFFLDSWGLQLFIGLGLVFEGIGILPGDSLGDKGLWVGVGLLTAALITTLTDLIKARIARKATKVATPKSF
jgi:hypothetical protein